jgi:hypothetical protein
VLQKKIQECFSKHHHHIYILLIIFKSALARDENEQQNFVDKYSSISFGQIDK